jgi:hypothetical protein
MEDVETMGLISAASMLTSTLLALIVEIALLAVALGPVRKHRPDVAGLVAAAGAILLAGTLAGPCVSMGGNVLAARAGGPSEVLTFQAATGLCFGLIHTGGFAMLVGALARLAAPRRDGPREPS